MKDRLLKMVHRSVLMPEFICGIFVLLFFTIHLFVFGPEGYKNITIVKYISFLAISGCFCASMLLCRIVGRNKAIDGGTLSATEVCVMAYMLLTVVSAAVSEFYPETILGVHRREGAVTICIYCVIFLMVDRNLKSEKCIIYLLGIVSTVFSAVCILQFFKINVFNLFPEGLNYYDGGIKYAGEFLGTMGNAGLTAAFLCLSVPILLIYILRAKERGRIWLLIPLFMGMAVLFKSKIAAAVLGLAAGLFFILPFSLCTNKRSQKVLSVVEAFVFIVIIALLFFIEFENKTLHEFHEVLHGNFDDSYGSSRIFIWRHTLPLIPERPIFGGGADTLADRIGVIFETVKDDGTVRKASIDAAHNEYLNIAVCQGIPALIAYIAALVSTFMRFIKSGNRSPATAALAAGLMCYCVQAFFGISIFISSPYFWIVWAILESNLKSSKNKKMSVA